MNTREIVMLSSDTNYIPVKYAVLEVSISNNLTGSYAWLKCVSHGVSSEDNYDAIVSDYDAGKGVNSSLILGTVGEYSVVSLSAVKAYASPVTNQVGNLLIG